MKLRLFAGISMVAILISSCSSSEDPLDFSNCELVLEKEITSEHEVNAAIEPCPTFIEESVNCYKQKESVVVAQTYKCNKVSTENAKN